MGTQGFQIETIGASVVAARCVAGVCGNFRVPAMSCMADLSTPETASRNFGLLGAVVGIALIMGPLIAMLLLRLEHLRLVFLASATLNIVNILIISSCWPPAIQRPWTSWREADPVYLVRSTVGRTPTLKIYGVMNFLDAFASSMFFGTMALFTKYRFGWTKSNIAPFFLCFGLLVPLQLGVVLPLLLKLFGEPVVLKLGYGLSCLAFFLFFLTGLTERPELFMAVLFPFTHGFISNPTQTVMANREVEEWELGRLSGAYSILETSGKTIAPLTAALLLSNTLESALPSFVYLAAATVLFPGVVLSFRIASVLQREKETDDVELTETNTGVT